MILVTGATGRIGSRAVAMLARRGARVRALSRGRLPVAAGWTDVECVVGDLGDPVAVARAVAGTESVFLLSPIDPNLDRYEEIVISAAERAGVGHVVKLSTTAPAADSPISWWRAHFRAERRLRAGGLSWTILRPNGIATFLLDFAPQVRAARTFSTAAGSGRMALVDPGDVAAVAVELLDGSRSATGEILDLTGPEAVSYDDVAATLTDLLGVRVVHRGISPDRARALLGDRGLLGWEVEGVLANWLMTRDGIGDFARVTGDVARVLGRPPRPVRAWLQENLDAFRSAA